MLTIKFTIYEILTGVQSWINKTLDANIEIFDNNYTELYIYPKKVDLYVKIEKGKKNYYKKIDHFSSVDNYNTDMMITLEDHRSLGESVRFDCELAIEEDYHKENK